MKLRDRGWLAAQLSHVLYWNLLTVIATLDPGQLRGLDERVEERRDPGAADKPWDDHPNAAGQRLYATALERGLRAA